MIKTIADLNNLILKFYLNQLIKFGQTEYQTNYWKFNVLERGIFKVFIWSIETYIIHKDNFLFIVCFFSVIHNLA